MKVMNSYKNISLGQIPEEWQVNQLKELYPNIRNGFVGTATPYYVSKGVKYLQGKNVKKGSIDPKNIIYISNEFHEKQKKSQLRTNDIVMVQSGHVGESAIVTEEYDNSNCHALLILTPKKNVSSRFYSYLFNSDFGLRIINRIKTGNTVAHILSSDIKKVVVPTPPEKEQKKIADILYTWDKAVKLKQQLIDLKKEQKKGLMQKLLTGEVRLKGFNDDFKKVKLKDNIIEVRNRNRDNIPIPILSVTNSNGFVKQTQHFGKRIASIDVSKYKIVSKGEFAYNPSRVNVGSIDRLNEYPQGLLSPMYVIFKANEKKLSPQYLKQYLLSNEFNEKIKGLLEGSVRQSLSFKSLQRLSLLLPMSIQEQESVSQILITLDREIELLEKEIETLKEQKKGLMQQLLTGKTRVKV